MRCFSLGNILMFLGNNDVFFLNFVQITPQAKLL